MSGIEELKHDVKEAQSLLTTASRKRFKDLLSIELNKLENEILKLESADNKQNVSPSIVSNKLYTSLIRNYSWDQSDKFMKIYISLNGIHNISKDNSVCNFTEVGLALKVNDLNGKNHELKISKLAYPINPDKSHIKIKTDMLVIFAAKVTVSKWEVVTAEEKRIADAKKSAEPKTAAKSPADPQDGLMDMMKKMYEDGDDEMKRMLNKTWYESQNKKKTDDPASGLGDLMGGGGGGGGMADLMGGGGGGGMADLMGGGGGGGGMADLMGGGGMADLMGGGMGGLMGGGGT